MLPSDEPALPSVRNEAVLRSFCARIFGWANDPAVDHALRSIGLAADHRAALVLLGETDLVPIAYALHRRALGAERPFVMCDPRRGNAGPDRPATAGCGRAAPFAHRRALPRSQLLGAQLAGDRSPGARLAAPAALRHASSTNDAPLTTSLVPGTIVAGATWVTARPSRPGSGVAGSAQPVTTANPAASATADRLTGS
jgi:hypothetical protein